MAKTPEAKVKDKVHAMLKQWKAYAVNYIGGAYANNGTPDILVCHNGRFIGIECKAGKGKPTALQIKNLRDIETAGGVGLVINETNLDRLCLTLDIINDGGHPASNYKDFERPPT